MSRPDVCELLQIINTPRGLDWDRDKVCDEAARHIVYLRRANLALHLRHCDQSDVIHDLRVKQHNVWLLCLFIGVICYLLGFNQGNF